MTAPTFQTEINPPEKVFHVGGGLNRDKLIPEQWLIAKIIPIHKKGSINNIENDRPVACLCSTTKIFESLILNRINKLEALNKINLAEKQQHGFTKGKSTATAGLLLQSLSPGPKFTKLYYHSFLY